MPGAQTRARRTASVLAALMASNAASFLLLPEMHREHHERLGVSLAMQRRVPGLMAAMSFSLLATRDRRRPRALVGIAVASYYVWAAKELASNGERPLAAYGLVIAGAAASLVPPAVTRE